MSYYIDEHTINNIRFITKAEAVQPSDTSNLPVPGQIFIDDDGTEGRVKCELLNGGTVVLALTKGIPVPFIVKKVFATGTTAVNVRLNPISQRK